MLSDEYRPSLLVETVRARGHPSVVASHRTTFELTRESHLTTRGDCVLAVAADKGPRDLDRRIREALQNDEARVIAVLRAGGETFTARGRGSQGLSLTHPKEMVFRKSRFISDRTVMVASDRAACDVPRDMVAALRNPDTRVELTLSVLVPQQGSMTSLGETRRRRPSH
ncbi:MAG: DUF371 domain-containing protein [Candidatus Bathyarchaeia archaeon]